MIRTRITADRRIGAKSIRRQTLLACTLCASSALVLPAARAQPSQPEPAAPQVEAGHAPEVGSSAVPGCAPPLPSAEERLWLSDELSAVEERLTNMHYQHHDGRIGGPIAMVASGYGTALVSHAVAVVSFTSAEDVQHWDANDEWHGRLDANDDGTIVADDERVLRRVARGFGVLSAVGAAVGVTGSVLLAKRMRERRRYLPELRNLQRRQRELHQRLDYGVNVSSRGLEVGLRGRF